MSWATGLYADDQAHKRRIDPDFETQGRWFYTWNRTDVHHNESTTIIKVSVGTSGVLFGICLISYCRNLSYVVWYLFNKLLWEPQLCCLVSVWPVTVGTSAMLFGICLTSYCGNLSYVVWYLFDQLLWKPQLCCLVYFRSVTVGASGMLFPICLTSYCGNHSCVIYQTTKDLNNIT